MSAYAFQDELFSSFDLRERLGVQRAQLDEALAALEDQRLLDTAPEQLVSYFVQNYQIEAPTLRRHEWQAETDDYVDDNTTAHRLEIEVPFDGDAQWFGAQAGPWSGISCPVRINGQSLLLSFEIKHGAEQAARAQIERELHEIEKALEWIRQEIKTYDARLRATVEVAIQTRRQRAMAHHELVASLGIPLRKRSDSQPDRLITARPNPTPILLPPANDADVPEPTLTPDHLGQVIETLAGAVGLLGHSPSLYATMDEEQLRNHVLVLLNGQFDYTEGNSQGIFETVGHNAIGLRSGARFAFLAECLFWTNVTACMQSVEHSLSHPLCRNASLVLVVFSRSRTLNRLVSNIRSAMTAYPLCIQIADEQPENGCTVTLQRPGQPDHLVQLDVRVFKAPKAEAKPLRPSKPARRSRETSRDQARFDF
jgi:hypothetical protein